MKSKILKNIFSLGIAEIANKGIMAFVSFYLFRVVSPEGNGIFNTATTYAVFLLIIVSYGLDPIGIRSVANKREDIPKYANSILTVRLIVAFFSFALLASLVLASDFALTKKLVCLTIGSTIISASLSVNWAFQAIERMGFLAARNVIYSIIIAIGVFLFVRQPSDVLIAAIIYACSNFINSFWLLAAYSKVFNPIRISRDFKLIKSLFIEAAPVVAFSLIGGIYSYLNIAILNSKCGDYASGMFSMANKFYQISIIPAIVLQNSFFPRISSFLDTENKKKLSSQFLRSTAIVTAFIAGSCFFFVYPIVSIINVKYIPNAIAPIQIISIVMVIAALNIVFSQSLLAWKKEKIALKAMIIGGIISPIANLIVIPIYQATGAAYGHLICEAAVFCILLYYYSKEVGFSAFLKGALAILAAAISGLIATLTKNIFISVPIFIILFIALIPLLKIFSFKEIRGLIRR